MKKWINALRTIAALGILLWVGIEIYQSGNFGRPFDADDVTAEIVNMVGGRTLATGTAVASVCGLQSSDNAFCLDHNRVAAEVHELVDRIIGRTNAFGYGTWTVDTSGYFRHYEYEDDTFYSVFINNDILIVRW